MMTVADYQSTQPQDWTFQDGVEEMGIGVEDTEDVVGDFLGGIGNAITAPIRAIGALTSGNPGGAIGALANPFSNNSGQPQSQQPPMPGGTGPVSQGVSQALGLGPASSGIGSLLGAGLGGIGGGTGPLPGPLGSLVSSLFGSPSIPPQGQAVGQVGSAQYNELADHTEKAGRAVVRRVLGVVGPNLDKIQQLLNLRRNQIQATAEHHQISTAQNFQREVLGRLNTLTGPARSVVNGRY